MQKINFTSLKHFFLSLLLTVFISGFGQERPISKSSIIVNKPILKLKQQADEKINSRTSVSLSNIQTKSNQRLLTKVKLTPSIFL